METFTVDRFYCIGLELAACDLATYIRSECPNRRLPYELGQTFGFQLFSGLAHLWEFRVVHSDIKLENLLLDPARKRLMIGDFGISRVPMSEEHCFTGL